MYIKYICVYIIAIGHVNDETAARVQKSMRSWRTSTILFCVLLPICDLWLARTAYYNIYKEQSYSSIITVRSKKKVLIKSYPPLLRVAVHTHTHTHTHAYKYTGIYILVERKQFASGSFCNILMSNNNNEYEKKNIIRTTRSSIQAVSLNLEQP